jgi:tripartite-type tricarboxylate transporter receptor subunit TctC
MSPVRRLPAFLASRIAVLGAACALVAGVTAWPVAAHAQSAWPQKPIHVIVPFPPGGPTDVLGRLVGQALGEAGAASVVVENKTGAAGNIGVAQIAKGTADGTTLGVVPVGNIAVNPALFSDLPYKAAELAPVTMLATVENVLVVNAEAVPERTLKELLARAAARPGTLSYASPGAGSQAHLAGALLELDTGVKLLHVPYRGIAPAVTDLVGGQVSMMFAPFQTVLPHIRSGKLRALGVASLRRSSVMPELPTLAEQGVPNFEAVSWYALMVPAGTPSEMVDRLQAVTARALARPETRERLAALGMDAGGGTPAQLAATVQAETARWTDVVRKQNIKPE